MKSDHIIRKIERLRLGGRPRLLDLFSGCGGLSLGFASAGFHIAAAIELEGDAARSHGINFHRSDPRHSRAVDITTTHPEDLVSQLDLGAVPESIDVIVGGPPCQAFARVGRPKLREIEAHPQAFMHDPRARLYKEYLRYVDAFQPLALLMENVPDVLNHGGQNIAEETCEVLESKGYVCGYTLLNAAFYGVPQMRERMFLIAYRQELDVAVRFPRPSHWMRLPVGYEGSRSVALKTMAASKFYIEPPRPTHAHPSAVTAEEALGDLPAIYARELLAAGTLRRGARRLDQPMPYDRRRRISPYAAQMREWPGFEAPAEGLRDHVIRFLPRDYELFARLNPGDQYPEAYAHAAQMFNERLTDERSRGNYLKPGSAAFKKLWQSIVPPYDVNKFPNKWRKLWRDQPARTLMAHLGKDSYSHIHYDSRQARTISVREAARLQSFPDGFLFAGTMNPAFKQIGNAVPPLLARAIGLEISIAIGTVRSTGRGTTSRRQTVEVIA